MDRPQYAQFFSSHDQCRAVGQAIKEADAVKLREALSSGDCDIAPCTRFFDTIFRKKEDAAFLALCKVLLDHFPVDSLIWIPRLLGRAAAQKSVEAVEALAQHPKVVDARRTNLRFERDVVCSITSIDNEESLVRSLVVIARASPDGADYAPALLANLWRLAKSGGVRVATELFENHDEYHTNVVDILNALLNISNVEGAEEEWDALLGKVAAALSQEDLEAHREALIKRFYARQCDSAVLRLVKNRGFKALLNSPSALNVLFDGTKKADGDNPMILDPHSWSLMYAILDTHDGVKCTREQFYYYLWRAWREFLIMNDSPIATYVVELLAAKCDEDLKPEVDDDKFIVVKGVFMFICHIVNGEDQERRLALLETYLHRIQYSARNFDLSIRMALSGVFKETEHEAAIHVTLGDFCTAFYKAVWFRKFVYAQHPGFPNDQLVAFRNELRNVHQAYLAENTAMFRAQDQVANYLTQRFNIYPETIYDIMTFAFEEDHDVSPDIRMRVFKQVWQYNY